MKQVTTPTNFCQVKADRTFKKLKSQFQKRERPKGKGVLAETLFLKTPKLKTPNGIYGFQISVYSLNASLAHIYRNWHGTSILHSDGYVISKRHWECPKKQLQVLTFEELLIKNRSVKKPLSHTNTFLA